jgi:hypothetical protein
MEEETGAMFGQVGIVDMELWQGHSTDHKTTVRAAIKEFRLLSLITMLFTTLFHLRDCVLSCVRYSGSICVLLSVWL